MAQPPKVIWLDKGLCECPYKKSRPGPFEELFVLVLLNYELNANKNIIIFGCLLLWTDQWH